MKPSNQQLWQVIRAREKSLAATKTFYDDWIRQEQTRRDRVEAELKRVGELLKQTERQVASERDGRRQEMTAKEKVLQAIKREAAARQRWEKICHEAEQQLTTLRQQLTAEAGAHASARKLLTQAERQVAAERATRQREAVAKDKAALSLKAEVEAHARWEQLCHEAEQQLTNLRQQLATEAGAHAASKKLLAQSDQQVAAERTTRQHEAAAKEKAQQSLKAESEARQRWEKLCHEAEQQLTALRQQLATEAAAHAASRKLLAQSDQQVAAERGTRQREAAAKEKIQQALQAETDAHHHWEKLCEETEKQLAVLRQQLAAEAKAHAAAQKLVAQTEQQVAAERATAQREAAAKEKIQQALQAETDAHRHWEKLCAQTEQQLVAVRQQLATEGGAHAAAKKLLAQAEQQIASVDAAREREVTAKEKTLQALQAEAEARQHWEKICHEAEQQLVALRGQLATEAGAKEAALQALKAEADSHAATRKTLAQTERNVTSADAGRRQESTAKEAALQALKAEADAHAAARKTLAQTEKNVASADAGRRQELAAKEAAVQALKAEAEAHAATRKNLAQTEKNVASADASRRQELAAKEAAVQALQAETEAHTRWEQLCHEAEAQRDALGNSVAENQRARETLQQEATQLQEELGRQNSALAGLQIEHALEGARLSEIALRSSRVAFVRELENEQARLDLFRRTFFGRWLALRNAGARLVRRIYCVLRGRRWVPERTGPGPRVTQVNTHDIVGGAERASYDLHLQFRQRGLGPTLIVAGKFGQDADVMPIPFREYDWKYAPIWRDRWGLTEILYPTPVIGCFKWPQLREAHVVHIHNMHGHSWNSATLLPLGLQHPVVLTLHDEYTMTGDCCYSHDCERWTRSCGKCPQIGLPRAARYALGGRDLTRLNVHLKRFLFHAPRAYPLAIVTPSRWLARRARRSPNLRHLPVISINNGVDLDYWHPLPQAEARKALALPEGRTIGLIVANHISDPRKGFDIALNSIRLLPRDTNLLFVIVGNISEETKAALADLPVIATGFVSDKFKMLNLFSAADFTFSMSRMDNLPYMCVESLACGRPVFGSESGGIPEIVDDPALGWLAPQPHVPALIAATLQQIDRESPETRHQRFAACRRSAEARFGLKLMTERYLALYDEMLLATAESRPLNLLRLNPDPRLAS